MTFEDYQRWQDNEEDRQNRSNHRRGRICRKKGVFERDREEYRGYWTPSVRPNLPPGNIFDFGEYQPEKATQIASLDPGWGAGFDPDWIENQQAIIEGIQKIFPEFANIALDFVPIVGDVKGVAEAIAGRDITGAELANWERALGAVPFFGGILKKVEAGKKVKGFIKLPGVWVSVEKVGAKFDELIEYLASKLPSWKQRTRFAIASEGGFEAPTEVASSMMNAMTGANAGVTFLSKYKDSFNLKLWGKAEGAIIPFLKRSGLTNELKEEVVQT